MPLPAEAALPDGTDPRYARCAAAWEGMQQVTPLLAAMHPMEPDHIHEELELMGPDFASYNFEWLSMSPRWRDHYLGDRPDPALRVPEAACCSCCSGSGGQSGKRWVLKCPQHLEQLPVLLRGVSGCDRGVHAPRSGRRDPVDHHHAGLYAAHPAPAGGNAPGCATIGWRASSACCAPAYAIASWQGRARSVDCPFHVFMRDPWSILEAGVCQGSAAADRGGARLARSLLAAHPRGKAGQVLYDLQARFRAWSRAAARALRILFRPLRRARRKD